MSDPAVVVVGSVNQDLAFETPSLPAPGETRLGTFRTGPGGKGFNQAVAAHRQEVRTCFVGAVGDDDAAAGLRRFVDAEGLSARLQLVPGVTTGAAGIIVDDAGQNLIVVGLGANEALSPEHVEAQEATIAGAQVVLTQLECGLDATRRALEVARRHGTTTVLNPAPINVALDPGLLELVDVLVPNESEYAFLLDHAVGVDVGDPAGLDDAALIGSAAQLGVPTVVVTLGSAGAAVIDPPAATCTRIEAVDVTAVDTTGAGDAFCGGLGAGLVRFGGDVVGAVRYANAVAGLSTQRVGAAPAMPGRADVEARGSRHPTGGTGGGT